MKLIPLSKNSKKYIGKHFAMVDDADFDVLNKFNWQVFKHKHTFYATMAVGSGKGNQKNVFMHRYILGLVDTKVEAHHKDHNGLNNQRNNIISCTHRQNLWDRVNTGRSKYAGVCITKFGTYRAAIRNADGKKEYLGSFKNETEAAKAYNIAAIKYRGEYAGLNEIL